jgi:hypothetical protein
MPLPESLKNILRGNRGSNGHAGPSRSSFPSRSGEQSVSTRQSRGLEEFFSYIRDQSGLTILDLGGATQQNVSFITNLGHRLYSEDFLTILRETFGADAPLDQSNPGQVDYFLRQALDYPPGQFDGVLAWDVLEYLGPVLLPAVVERLHKVVKPKSYILAFFHSEAKLEAVPFYTFRIQAMNSLRSRSRAPASRSSCLITAAWRNSSPISIR